MDEIDDLLESLLQRRNAAKMSYVDDEYVDVLKVKETKSQGQGLFTQPALSVTTPICSLSYPVIAAIDSEALRTTCYHCLIVTEAPLPIPSLGHTEVELKTCNGCRSAYFCNKDCQTKAWHAFHKYECRIFNKLRLNLPPTTFRAVMRMVLLKDRDMISTTEWDRVAALVSHDQIMLAQGQSNLTTMAASIKHLTRSAMSVGQIQKLIFIMKFNATELPTPIYGSIGVMLSPLMAKFNHSCQPNIAMRRPQHTMISGWMDREQVSPDKRGTFAEVITLRDVKEGEELFNCYIAPTASVTARKAKLASDYLFECKCSKCESDTAALAQLTAHHPRIQPQFDQWTKTIARHLSRTPQTPTSLHSAASTANNLTQFAAHPTLYTTGDYPQMTMELISETLKAQLLDEALINALRLYFLVNPTRFVGRHNPTNIYTAFLILDIFDALLLDTAYSKIASGKVDECLRRLQGRGLARRDLRYWRDRICADLRGRIEGTAARDLLVLVEKRERWSLGVGRDVRVGDCEDGEGVEGRMGGALGVKGEVWLAALRCAAADWALKY